MKTRLETSLKRLSEYTPRGNGKVARMRWGEEYEDEGRLFCLLNLRDGRRVERDAAQLEGGSACCFRREKLAVAADLIVLEHLESRKLMSARPVCADV